MDESSHVHEFIGGVGKLEGASNYLVWAFRVKQLLKLEEAWSVVVREIPSGHDGSDSQQVKEKKNKAMYILASTLSESVLLLITDLSDPAAIWAKLRTHFEARSMTLMRESSETLAMLPVLSSDPQDVNGSSLLNTTDADLSNASVQTELSEIQKKKNLAMVILVESVEDHIVPLIMDLDDPADVWARLRYLFEEPSSAAPPNQRSSAAAAA